MTLRFRVPQARILLLASALQWLVIGCENRDSQYGTARTLSALEELAAFAEHLDQNGVSVCDCRSVDELLRLANRNGLISDAVMSNSYYHKDAWGNLFKIVIEDRKGVSWLTVSSTGPNPNTEEGTKPELSKSVRLSKPCVRREANSGDRK